MPWPAGGRFLESQPSGREFHLASSETIGTPTAAIPGRMRLGIQNRHIKPSAALWPTPGPTAQRSKWPLMAPLAQLRATCQIFADHTIRTGKIGRAPLIELLLI